MIKELEKARILANSTDTPDAGGWEATASRWRIRDISMGVKKA
jgi:hypothetical protein